MVKHIINNFALIKNGESYSKVDHCTTYADNDIDIIRFVTEAARDKYISENNIVIVDESDLVHL